MDTPEAGVVYDGFGLVDINFVSVVKDRTLGATWRGFSDLGSGIASYRVCVGTTPGGEDVVPCINVGLATQHKFTLPDNIPNGNWSTNQL